MAFVKGEVVGRLDENGEGWIKMTVKPLLELPQTAVQTKRPLPVVDKLRRPTGKAVKENIGNGSYANVHPSKAACTCTQISAEINSIEKRCALTRTEWSQEAQDLLEKWLSCPKRARTLRP